MSQSNHHRFHSLGSVPFSWEYSPGISKIAPQAGDSSTSTDESPESVHVIKLPPPPCPDDRPRRFAGRHGIHVPLPPCPFQPPSKFSSKGLRRDEDPFLAAYMECTKGVKKKKEGKKRTSGWGMSCKQGSGVREDGLVRLSQVGKVHARDRWWLDRSQSQGSSRKGTGIFYQSAINK